MSDRAIITLLPALSLGFICGIVVATLQMEGSSKLLVGLVGCAAVVLAGVSSVFGVRGDGGEKALVATLRSGCAVGVFVCIYLFILGFLSEGSMVSLIWLPLALALGVVSTRIVVRDRADRSERADAA